MEFLDDDIDVNDVKADVVGPYGKVDCKLDLRQYGGKGSFTPNVVGMHQVKLIQIYNQKLYLMKKKKNIVNIFFSSFLLPMREKW